MPWLLNEASQGMMHGTKVCAGCKLPKVIGEFSLAARKNRPSTHGRHPRCHDCRKDSNSQYYRDRKAADPGYARNVSRKSTLAKYGLTPAQYEALAEEQGYCCAICNREPGVTSGVDRHNLVVDHDHANGRVRALLCDFCNRGLGIFRDDPELLIAAAMYALGHAEAGGGLTVPWLL